MSKDPSVIRSVAVTTADVVAAVEMNRTSGKRAVLRLTPPFSGRMRARLHVDLDQQYGDNPAPIYLDPDMLLADDAPAYPRPAVTEDELRNDPDRTYTVERHHEYHAEVVDEWRDRIPDAICDAVTLEMPDDSTEVTVKLLGGEL